MPQIIGILYKSPIGSYVIRSTTSWAPIKLIHQKQLFANRLKRRSIPMDKPVSTRRVKDISSAAAAFSQVTGILGGFAVTIVVLALSPGAFQDGAGKDWIVGIVLLGAAIYITASGLLANAMTFEDPRMSGSVFNVGIFLFHLGNLMLCVGILLTTFQIQMLISRVVAGMICLLAGWFAIINFFPIIGGVRFSSS